MDSYSLAKIKINQINIKNMYENLKSKYILQKIFYHLTIKKLMIIKNIQK